MIYLVPGTTYRAPSLGIARVAKGCKLLLDFCFVSLSLKPDGVRSR